MAPSDHRIPRIYKEGAKILKEVLQSKKGLKDVIYSNRNRMLYKKLFVLLDKYLDNQNSINKFIEETKLTQNVKDEYVVRILCTELLHGRKSLPSIENNTMMTVNKAYEVYCNENHSDIYTNIPTNYKAICDDSLNQFIARKKKLRYVRVNTLILNVEECIIKLTNDGFLQLPNAKDYDEFLNTIMEYTERINNDEEYFIQDYHLSDGLVFLQSTHFHNYALYKNGSLFLQDKASCVPTHLLSPPAHSVVFDTCAAPGNKTLHLAAFMQNTGTVYAVDKDPKRFKYMKEVVELANGSQVVQPILSDIFEIKMADFTDVEYVLVDPSCSGTGITERAKIDNHEQMSLGRIKNLSGFQKDLLGRVCTYFPNVKRIVYCTCSLQEEENEQVVEDIVAKYGNKFQVENLRQHPTLTGWKHFGKDKYEEGRKCFYALPQDYCTGFFAAVFNRKDDWDHVINGEHRDRYIKNFNDEVKKIFDASNNEDVTQNDRNDSHIQETSEHSMETSDSLRAKKKKKRKTHDVETCDNNPEQNKPSDDKLGTRNKIDNTSVVDDVSCKSIEKKSSENETCEEEKNCAASEDVVGKQKKKQKRKDHTEKLEEMNAKVSIEKKKRKCKDLTDDLDEEVELETAVEKKKKHKRKDVTEDLDVEVELETAVEKKKKHKRKDVTEDLNVEVKLETAVEKKKKHKRKNVTEDLDEEELEKKIKHKRKGVAVEEEAALVKSKKKRKEE